MSKLKVYFEETYNELFNKVSWPTWSEVQSSAIVVMIASLIIAMVIYIMDKTSSEVLKLFYNTF